MNRRTYLGVVGLSVLPIGYTLHEYTSDEWTIERFQNNVPQSIQGRSLNDVWADDERKYSIAMYESSYGAIQIQFFPHLEEKFTVMLHSADYQTAFLDDAVSIISKFILRCDVEYERNDDVVICHHEFVDGSYIDVYLGDSDRYRAEVNGRVMEFDGPTERNEYTNNFVINKIK